MNLTVLKILVTTIQTKVDKWNREKGKERQKRR
jgi:hypothetical protein